MSTADGRAICACDVGTSCFDGLLKLAYEQGVTDEFVKPFEAR